MKIAIFGDIHGNIEALKVAWNTAINLNVEKIYHTGDLVGYGPFVKEVIEFLIEHKIEGVQGNYDEAVANNKEHCGCRYENPLQAEMAQISFEWTKAHITERERNFLRNLPFEIAFDIYNKKVKIFHATPLKNNLYWYEERDEKFFIKMGNSAQADVLIYGHTHIPYRKDIGGRVFINAGSVGRPKDGDNRTCICIVEITPENVKSEFIRIPYDIEKMAKAIMEGGLPPYFAETLRAGR